MAAREPAGGLCVRCAPAFSPEGGFLVVPWGAGAAVVEASEFRQSGGLFFGEVIGRIPKVFQRSGDFERLLYVGESGSGGESLFVAVAPKELVIFKIAVEATEGSKPAARHEEVIRFELIPASAETFQQARAVPEAMKADSLSDAVFGGAAVLPSVDTLGRSTLVLVLESKSTVLPSSPTVLDVFELDLPKLLEAGEMSPKWLFGCLSSEESALLDRPLAFKRGVVHRLGVSRDAAFVFLSLNSLLYVYCCATGNLVRFQNVDPIVFSTGTDAGGGWLCMGDRVGRSTWWKVLVPGLYSTAAPAAAAGGGTAPLLAHHARAGRVASTGTFIGPGRESFTRTVDRRSAGDSGTDLAARPTTVLSQRWHSTGVLCALAAPPYVVTGGEEGVLVFWHIEQNERFFVATCGAPIVHLACAETAERVLLAASLVSNEVRVYDVGTQETVARIAGFLVPESMTRTRGLCGGGSYVPDAKAPRLLLPLNVRRASPGYVTVCGTGSSVQLFNTERDLAVSGALAADMRPSLKVSTSRSRWNVSHAEMSSDLRCLVTVEWRNRLAVGVSDSLDRDCVGQNYYDDPALMRLAGADGAGEAAAPAGVGAGARDTAETRSAEASEGGSSASDEEEGGEEEACANGDGTGDGVPSTPEKTAERTVARRVRSAQTGSKRRFCARPGVRTDEVVFAPVTNDGISDGRYCRLRFWDAAVDDRATLDLSASTLVTQIDGAHSHAVTAVRAMPAARLLFPASSARLMANSGDEVLGPWIFITTSLDGSFRIFTRHTQYFVNTRTGVVSVLRDEYRCARSGGFRQFPIFDLAFSTDTALGAAAHANCVSIWQSGAAAAAAPRLVSTGCLREGVLSVPADLLARRCVVLQRPSAAVIDPVTAKGVGVTHVAFVESVMQAGGAEAALIACAVWYDELVAWRLTPLEDSAKNEKLAKDEESAVPAGAASTSAGDAGAGGGARETPASFTFALVFRKRLGALVFSLDTVGFSMPAFAVVCPARKTVLALAFESPGEAKTHLSLRELAQLTVAEESRLLSGGFLVSPSSHVTIFAIDGSFKIWTQPLDAASGLARGGATPDTSVPGIEAFPDDPSAPVQPPPKSELQAIFAAPLTSKKGKKSKSKKGLLENYLLTTAAAAV